MSAGINRIITPLIVAFALLTSIPTFAEQIIYVDADASGNNDGSSWIDAYNFLQDALVAASSGDEIRVAEGIYRPDENTVEPYGTGNREATFQLINGVTLKGGYAGFGELHPNARDIELYKTILSGDLNGDDVVVNDPRDLLYEPTRAENSYHVVTAGQMLQTAVLDGFTITGGNADDDVYPFYHEHGGGMHNTSNMLTITNCTFVKNSAGYYGGAIYSDNKPEITNCIISENSAINGGGLTGCDGPISNSVIVRNHASSGGGLSFCKGPITNCIISDNTARSSAGGLLHCDGPVTNCIITGNEGRGLFACAGPIANCTIVGNIGSGLFACRGSITNCIIWDNSDVQIEHSAQPTFSNIKGGWPGEGNIDIDPFFIDPGYWDANGMWIEGDYHLLPDSPCINVGDPNHLYDPNEIDLDGNPRVIGGRIDMGAYEASIFAEARIVPQTINLASKGKWITCYIWLPEQYNVTDIDPNSVLLEDEIKPNKFSVDEQQQVATARFYRSDVQTIINVGEIELSITGRLTDGTVFEATDIIRVIDKRDKK